MSDEQAFAGFDQFATERLIGQAGAAIFRSAYEALADQTADQSDDTMFSHESAERAALAILEVWPKLLTSRPEVTTEVADDEAPGTGPIGVLHGGTELFRMLDGTKLYVQRDGDDFEIEIVGETEAGRMKRRATHADLDTGI